MIWRAFILSFQCLTFLISLGPLSAEADRIVLKDGTIEESDRVWESERYVHFILKGTQTVEIRYAKEIVARIERPGTLPIQDIKPKAKPVKPVEESPLPTDSPSRQETPQIKSDFVKPALPIDRNTVKNNRGLKFFDPRRPQRYWAARTSRHDTLSAAIEALARIYGKPPAWIETHMGEENDLGLIHESLIAAYDKEGGALDTGTETSALEKQSQAKDDGRPKPGEPTVTDNGMGADIKAVAPLLDESVRQPQETSQAAPNGHSRPHGGNGNSSNPTSLSTGNHHRGDFPEIPKGIPFYDPRRAEKYWVDEMHRFNSLNDALKELAALYGVSEEWIGDHLGKTNDLYQIHQSIRENLTSE